MQNFPKGSKVTVSDPMKPCDLPVGTQGIVLFSGNPYGKSHRTLVKTDDGRQVWCRTDVFMKPAPKQENVLRLTVKELRETIREALNEAYRRYREPAAKTRDELGYGNREVPPGEEWDEGEPGDKPVSRWLNGKKPSRPVTPPKKVSETGAYYGKTASAKGAIMGGNGQKDPDQTSACGDPMCTGCGEDKRKER